MGVFRYVLSSMVVWFHLVGGHMCWGYSAVFGFYLISGYVITYVLEGKYKEHKTVKFYKNRLLRLLPTYYIYVVLTVLVIVMLGNSYVLALPQNIAQYGAKQFLNDLVLGFFTDKTNPALWLNGFPRIVPQAWSLWPQFVFYLVAPFLVRLHRYSKKLYGIFVTIMALPPICFYFLKMDFGTYGYRSLLGVFVIFLVGSCIFYLKDYLPKIKYPGILFSVLAFAYVGVVTFWGRDYISQKQIYVAFVIQVLIVASSTQLSLKGIIGRLDRIAGNISYGVFMGHFMAAMLVQIIAERLLPIDEMPLTGKKFGIAVIILQTIIASAGYYLVEKRIEKLRKKN
ncbi:MAG: Acyltransferase family protein [Bacteroidetes bacterium ADurb.Bin141]|nr:MAG: Acyltransferase family protein [Bacteroidetes bacterium ADurb.Bin141]